MNMTKCSRYHFLDTSAFIKLYFGDAIEPGASALRSYRKTHMLYYTTSLCVAEVLNVLKRKYSNGEMVLKDYMTRTYMTMSMIHDQYVGLSSFDYLDQAHEDSIFALIKKYNLDLVDAVSIVEVKSGPFSFHQGSSSQTLFITADRALCDVARQENIDVWNPVNENPPD